MPDLICPYSATLAQKQNFLCPDADEVIRRGGSEYVCLQDKRYDICCEVHDIVKRVYLNSQDLEDDLLSLPHSMFVKIQFGCILGLQSALGRDATIIDDVGSLVGDSINHHKNSNELPFELLNECITTYKLQRRGSRNK